MDTGIEFHSVWSDIKILQSDQLFMILYQLKLKTLPVENLSGGKTLS